jgi:lipopolysaccharide export system protein LptA
MTTRTPSTSSLPSRTGSTRGVGLFVAFLVAVVTIAGLWYISSSAPQAKPVAKPTDPNVGAAPKADDDLSGSGITLQLVDRDNPGRLAAELKLPSVQPLAAKRYAVESPSGWVYPRDGRIVHIRADKGDLFLPNRQQLPERGDFKGNVIVRLFPGPAGRAIDPDKETPLLVARTDTIAFDGAIGELQVPGRITIDGSGVAYAGSSLRILFNDPEQRIELLTAEQSEYLRIDPKIARTPPSLFASRDSGVPSAASPSARSNGATTAPSTPNTASGNAGPSSAPAAAPATAREQLYRIRVEDAVRVVQAARTIDAAAGEIYTRQSGSSTVANNARPTPPLNTPSNARAASTSAAITTVALQSPSSPAPLPPSSPAPLASSDSPVTITWLGRLELRPIASASTPEVLVNNDLAAVFYGATNAPARVVDAKAELSASGDTITYLDTRREARVFSDTALGSVLTAKARGRVLASAASMNLATGIATFTGAGQMENTDSETATPLPTRLPARDESPRPASGASSASRTIAWKDSALLRFVPDNRPGSTPTGDPSSLEFASFKGTVTATGGGASINADAVEASFVQAPGAEQPALSVVTLTGRAKGNDSKDGTLGADRVEVRFSPPLSGSKSNEAVAQGLIARGNVVAFSKGSTLHADALDAALSTDATPDANLGVTIAHAKGSVRFSRADGTRAESEELIADVPNQQAQLAGPVVVLAKGDSAVTGERMRLDGTTGRLEVVGPGVFQHEGKSKDGEPRLASARWTGPDSSMTFEDSTGVLEATSPNGRTVAEAMPDARTIDKLDAAFVRVLLTPSPADAPAKDREVLSVVATAAAPTSAAETGTTATPTATPGSKPAVVKVESRRYAAAITDLEEGDKKPARVGLERLLYLESTRVEADNAKGTVHVPAPGKLFVLAGKDAQAAEASASTPAARSAALSADLSPGAANPSRLDRSRSLFHWNGTMTMTRASAGSSDEHAMVMDGGVKLTSERESDKQLTQLDCTKLSAWLTPTPTSSNANPTDASPTDLRGELSRALAEGTARLKSGTKTLSGDLIDYNPADGTALAGSRDNSTVTLIDDESASPVTARGILWDMRRGRVEVKNVSTVVAPR